MHLADAFIQKKLTIVFRIYIFISMCVPWELNPQPFALLTQCSTTEPHRNTWDMRTSTASSLTLYGEKKSSLTEAYFNHAVITARRLVRER